MPTTPPFAPLLITSQPGIVKLNPVRYITNDIPPKRISKRLAPPSPEQQGRPKRAARPTEKAKPTPTTTTTIKRKPIKKRAIKKKAVIEANVDNKEQATIATLI